MDLKPIRIIKRVVSSSPSGYMSFFPSWCPAPCVRAYVRACVRAVAPSTLPGVCDRATRYVPVCGRGRHKRLLRPLHLERQQQVATATAASAALGRPDYSGLCVRIAGSPRWPSAMSRCAFATVIVLLVVVSFFDAGRPLWPRGVRRASLSRRNAAFVCLASGGLCS